MPTPPPGFDLPHRRIALALAVVCASAAPAFAVDTSAPAILQWFDGTYGTQQQRVADVFLAGYGSSWIPPIGKAETGGLSVGYDVFDRFNLGKPNDQTLYGTEAGLRQFVDHMHRSGADVTVDLVWNHNGFADTATPGFAVAGGYPGFVLSAPGLPDGDFHGAFESGDLNGRLAGLIDIRHETNIQLIRTPTTAGDPQNIPAGTVHNIPDPANERFYPDRDATPIILNNPLTGEQNIAVYPFASAAGGSGDGIGDAITENATGLLMRNARWLVQDVGIDGFRLDAARHFEPWVMGFFDQAVYRASNRTLLNGDQKQVFSYSEAALSDKAQLLSQYVRKDFNPADPGRIAGNRDALDFPQFFAVRDNLTSNGIQNDWNNVVNAGLDVFDDGLVNGSSGVVFVQSHDDFGPAMMNVAYAFSMLRPGNAIAYYNAEEHSNPLRLFPKPGRGDALGNFGDTLTELIDLRNRYGRGNYRQRLLEKENYAYERSKSALVLLSNRNDAGFDARSIAVDFEPGTWLVELTGNAAARNAEVGSEQIKTFLQVQGTPGNAFVGARFLRNDGKDQGYLVYGVPTPESSAGLELIGPGVGGVLAGDTPPALVGGETDEEIAAILRENGQARLADLRIIDGNSFTVRLATDAVTLNVPGIPGGVRDTHADGDFAVVKINEGLDLNGNGSVDDVTPGSVTYGFENFVTTNTPGFGSATGDGLYEQTIDATQLPEGMNFLTVRAFRHRDAATGGDGGPAVFSEFKEVLYVDLLPPEVEFASQAVFDAGTAGIDFAFRSTDGTANSVHIFRNIGAAIDEQLLLAQANGGSQQANKAGELFQRGFTGVENGNQVFTVVTFEPTGNFSIERFVGIGVTDGAGAGFGDINSDGLISDLDLQTSFINLESIINSRNLRFDPAGDPNADGLVDVRDLLALAGVYEGPAAEPGTAAAYLTVLHNRGNQDASATFDAADIDTLYSRIGTTDDDDLWQGDLNVDGQVTADDVDVLVNSFFRTVMGDADLDGFIAQADLDAVLLNWGAAGTGWAGGDFNGNGTVEQGDLDAVLLNWGFAAEATGALGNNAVPEPGTLALLTLGSTALLRRRAHRAAGM